VSRARLALGVVALAVGALAAVAPGAVPLELGETVVPVVGALALLGALRVARRRVRSALDGTEPPDPEYRVGAPPPGDRLDPVLDDFLDGRGAYRRTRAGLRAAAAAVLVRYRGLSTEEASDRIDRGSWTDDDAAAAFLRDAASPDRSAGLWLRRRLGLAGDGRPGVDRAIDAVAGIAGVDPAGTDSERVRDRADVSTATPAGVDDGETERLVAEARETGHWQGVGAVALAGVGAGLVVGRPAVLLAGVVGVGFAAYARSALLAPGGPGAVAVSRAVETDRPDPGDAVEVTVTVENTGDRRLADLRVIDGVPPALSVVEGSPRLGTTLGPGESAEVRYAVEARRGVHEFDPALVLTRDLAGSVETERLVADGTTLTCVPRLRATAEPLALRGGLTQYAGRVETDTGGAGLEFHATREYRPGDPMGRIDWNRRARTGELTTVEFRTERAATVVLVVDAREAAYLAPDGGADHAVDRAVDAAGRLYAGLAGGGNRVGIAAVPAGAWLEPGSGTDHERRARELLATDPTFDPVAPPRTGNATGRLGRRELRRRLPDGAQVVLCTPLTDDVGGGLARRFEAYGHPVTVCSPDPTAARTPSQRLARVARRLRLSDLRSAGIPVVDWGAGESLDAALARHGERWSR
jgi:uncharacterized repeat protein (TIGR01451 family)